MLTITFSTDSILLLVFFALMPINVEFARWLGRNDLSEWWLILIPIVQLLIIINLVWSW